MFLQNWNEIVAKTENKIDLECFLWIWNQIAAKTENKIVLEYLAKGTVFAYLVRILEFRINSDLPRQ